MMLVAVAAQACAMRGDWDGALTVPAGIQIPLVLHLKDGGGSTLDSPDQNATGIAIDVTPSPDGVRVSMPSTKAEFAGTYSADCKTLAGPFRQNSLDMKASFTRRAPGAAAPGQDRPQTPKPPYPYVSRETLIPSGPATLSGTLTLPRGSGPFPAVVMIAGSGPQNRDETIEGHRLFLVIADDLTRHGIAVLRYDKRGVGKSTGSYLTATQADFAADARSALEWLRRQPGIDASRVGLVGHSEGAEIAPTVARADPNVAFAVLLSTPAETGAETIASQAKAIALASGVPAEKAEKDDALERRVLAAAATAPSAAAAQSTVEKLLVDGGVPSAQAAAQAAQVGSPWFKAFLNDDPLPALRALKIPTLVVAGSKDLQVLPSRNVPLIRQALAGNKRATIVEFPGLNHLLQPAGTGTPAEYGKITTTIDPGVLKLMGDWIARTTAR